MSRTETSFSHLRADMGSVRDSEHGMERAEDVSLWDMDGNRYLDPTAGLWYANVGHGRHEIRAAVAVEMERLDACSDVPDLATPRVVDSRTPSRSGHRCRRGSCSPLAAATGITTAARLVPRYWREAGWQDRTVLISRTAACHGTHGFGTTPGGVRGNERPADRRAGWVWAAQRDDPGARRLARGSGADIRTDWPGGSMPGWRRP